MRRKVDKKCKSNRTAPPRVRQESETFQSLPRNKNRLSSKLSIRVVEPLDVSRKSSARTRKSQVMPLTKSREQDLLTILADRKKDREKRLSRLADKTEENDLYN